MISSARNRKPEPDRYPARVLNRNPRFKVDAGAAGALLSRVAGAAGCRGGEVAVTLVSDDEIRLLNRRTFAKNETTNVISCRIDGENEAGEPFLGDVVISVDTAEREARQAGLTLAERVAQLMVHGVLHLCGYDHVGVPRAQGMRMRRAEVRVLREAGCGGVPKNWIGGRNVRKQ